MDKKSMSKESEAAQDFHTENTNEDVPPPYSTRDVQPTSSQLPISAAYPPKAHHTQAPSRTLLVEYTKWTLSGLRVYDKATSEDLYEAKIKYFKCNLSFTRTGGTNPFATVKFPSLASNFSVKFDHEPTLMVFIRTKWTHCEATYASPALHGAELTWKTSYRLKTVDAECQDEQGVVICRMQANVWTLKKAGKIEFFGDIASSDPNVMDELVVNGIAMLEYVCLGNSGTAVV